MVMRSKIDRGRMSDKSAEEAQQPMQIAQIATAAQAVLCCSGNTHRALVDGAPPGGSRRLRHSTSHQAHQCGLQRVGGGVGSPSSSSSSSSSAARPAARPGGSRHVE